MFPAFSKEEEEEEENMMMTMTTKKKKKKLTAFINPSGTEAVRMPSFSSQRGYKMCKSRIIPSSGLLTWGVNKGYVTVDC
jgi:hypothetical protein